MQGTPLPLPPPPRVQLPQRAPAERQVPGRAHEFLHDVVVEGCVLSPFLFTLFSPASGLPCSIALVLASCVTAVLTTRADHSFCPCGNIMARYRQKTHQRLVRRDDPLLGHRDGRDEEVPAGEEAGELCRFFGGGRYAPLSFSLPLRSHSAVCAPSCGPC